MLPDKGLNATGDSGAAVEFGAGDETMLAQGIYIAKLKQVTEPHRSVQKFPSSASDAWGELANDYEVNKVFKQLAKLSRNLDDVKKEVFWRSLVMDRDRTAVGEVYPAPQEFEAMQQVLLEQQLIPPSFRPELSEEDRRQYFIAIFLFNMPDPLHIAVSSLRHETIWASDLTVRNQVILQWFCMVAIPF